MFNTLVSQENAKKHFELYIKSAQMFNDRIPDILLSGPSGVGKSTFAREIAFEAGYNYTYYDPLTRLEIEKLAFFEVNSQAIKSIEDLYRFLTNDYQFEAEYKDNTYIFPRGIVFFDEAHKLAPAIRTQLLSAMDERRLVDFKCGRHMISKISFENITFMCATTDVNDLERALINRFKLIELQPYSVEDIARMVVARAPEEWSPNAAYSVGVEIGKRARTVMRTAVLDLETIDKYFRVNQMIPTAQNTSQFYEDFKEVDEDGLDHVDMTILEILSNYNLGIKSIASRMSKSEKEIQERISWLANIDTVIKAGGGQQITNKGLKKIGKESREINIMNSEESERASFGVNLADIHNVLEFVNGAPKRPSRAINTKAEERTELQRAQVKMWNIYKKTSESMVGF